MQNKSSRNPNGVCFLEADSSVDKPIIVSGSVFDVNTERNEFTVQVYHDDYRNFSYDDWETIVFETNEQAQALIDRLPKKGERVYRVDKVAKKMIFDTVECYVMPYIHFKSGAKARGEEIDKSYYASKERAFSVLDRLKKTGK